MRFQVLTNSSSPWYLWNGALDLLTCLSTSFWFLLLSWHSPMPVFCLALDFCLKATVFIAWCQSDWNVKRFSLYFQRLSGWEVNQGFIRAIHVSIHHGRTTDSLKRTALHLLHGRFLCFSSSILIRGPMELDVQLQRQVNMRQIWTSQSKGAEPRVRAHFSQHLLGWN